MLWQACHSSIVGMVQVLQSLRTSVTSSGNPLSEAEMDRHTLKGLREGGLAQQAALASASRTLLMGMDICCGWRRTMRRHLLHELHETATHMRHKQAPAMTDSLTQAQVQSRGM